MGIENDVSGTISTSGLSLLITPHGDRKRHGALPVGGQHPLITPHGDRKHGAVTVGENRSASSLPLMGIENFTDLRIAHRSSLKLITPHGDRKPSDLWAKCLSARTHYPSWGSKTSPDSASHSARSNISLPLMGIENPLSFSDRHPLTAYSSVRQAARDAATGTVP